jgi:hypothetical protein
MSDLRRIVSLRPREAATCVSRERGELVVALPEHVHRDAAAAEAADDAEGAIVAADDDGAAGP